MARLSARKDGEVGGRYKGVRMRKWGRWVAEVRQPNSRDRIWLGSYGTAEEAARAYDAASFCLRGPSAMLNFPSTPPEIPGAAKLSRSEIQVAASKHARKAPPQEEERLPPENEAAGRIPISIRIPTPNELRLSALFGETSDVDGFSEWNLERFNLSH